MPRGLLIAVAVLALLGGGIYWSEKHPKTDEEAKKKAVDSPKILALTDAQISELQLTKGGGEALVLSKAGDRWVMTKPVSLAADQDAVAAMIGSFAALNADRVIDEKPVSLVPFGLDRPSETVAIKRKDGKTDSLLFGANTPIGGNVYVKLAGDAKVYTLPATTKTTFEKTPEDLRDKRLLTFNTEKLTSVVLQSKGVPIEFAKNGQSDWQIVKPKTYRADNLQVDDLVRKLKDAKMDLAAGADAAKDFAKSAKLATVTVTDNSGPQTIEIRKGAEKTFYAKSSVVEGTYKLTGDLGDGLEKSVDDFRNKKLFDFGFSDPVRVDINGTAYDRAGDKWNVAGKQFDGPSMQAVIDKLRDFSAAKFAEKLQGGQVYSLAVTFGDQKRTEKVVIAKFGDVYQAQRDGEPSVYLVDAKTVDELQKAVSGIKPAAAESKETKKK